MLGIAVAVALLSGGGHDGAYSGGEDTPYPYTWTEKRDGSILLEIDRSAVPGGVWTVTGAGEGVAVGTTSDMAPVLTIRPRDGGARDKAGFLLIPSAAGRTSFTLSLTDAEGGEPLYALTVLAENRAERGRLNAYLLSAGGTQFQGDVSGGENTDYPYIARLDEYGMLVLNVRLPHAPDPEPENPEPELTEEEYLAAYEREIDEFLLQSGWVTPELLAPMTLDEKLEIYELAAGVEAVPDEEALDEEVSDTEVVDAEAMPETEPAAELPADAEAIPETEPVPAELPAQPEIEPGWNCVSDNDAVAEPFTLMYEDDGSVTAYLTPGTVPGRATVRMVEESRGLEIAFECEVDGSGSFLIRSHRSNASAG